MDSDACHCGTCKHGNLYDRCGKCEDEYEAKRKRDAEAAAATLAFPIAII